MAVTQASWEALAEKSALQKYRQFVLRSFVPLTGNVAWCPNPKCTRALRYRAAEMTDITCQCGMRFCVSCDAQAHSPATCEEYTQWQRDREGLEDLLSQRLLMQEYKKVSGGCPPLLSWLPCATSTHRPHYLYVLLTTQCPKCGVHLQRCEFDCFHSLPA